MLAVLSLSIISCKEETDLKSNITGKSKKTIINNTEINVLSYTDIDGKECEMLEFASTIDFDSTLSYLEIKTFEYEDAIDKNYGGLSEEEFEVLIDNGTYNDNSPLIDFENELTFTMSLRKKYDILENEWMAVEYNDELIHPKSLFPFSKFEMTLFNKYGEIKIGKSIFIFDSLGYIEITNGDIELLKYVKSMNYDVKSDEIIKVVKGASGNGEKVTSDCDGWEYKDGGEKYNEGAKKVNTHVHFHSYAWKGVSNTEITVYKKRSSKWKRHRTQISNYNYSKFYDKDCGGNIIRTDSRSKKTSNLNCHASDWNAFPQYRANREDPIFGVFYVENHKFTIYLKW